MPVYCFSHLKQKAKHCKGPVIKYVLLGRGGGGGGGGVGDFEKSPKKFGSLQKLRQNL